MNNIVVEQNGKNCVLQIDKGINNIKEQKNEKNSALRNGFVMPSFYVLYSFLRFNAYLYPLFSCYSAFSTCLASCFL